jgi:hypothetical protein
MEDFILKLAAQSPVALAILAVGALVRRWIEPFARELWREWREERAADRAKAEERTEALRDQASATREAAKTSERLADALRHIGDHGLRLDATPQNGKVSHGKQI